MTLSQGEIRTVIVGCLIALFLSALDQTIIATALPAIAADLGDFALISWVVTSYLLAATCATPILGKLSDLYGRRPMLLLCLFIFLAGSVLCAAAPSMGLLIAARALQGLGGGGLITLAQATVADIVSPRERARYSAYFATTWGLASVLGPTLGGVITEFLDWTWIFWINLPMGAVALLVADRALRKLPPRTSRGRIDLGSMALFATSALAFLLTLSFGGRIFPWVSLPTAGLVAVSLAAGALFWRRQRSAAEPIMPPRFLKDPVLAPLFLSMFLAFGSFIAISTLVPVYLKITLQLSASSVGLLMIGLMLSSTLSAGWAGQHLKRTGRYTLPPRLM
ncbi:MAG: MFS transporter, partial [Alphaproteobacteria bacterium]|nr:MFS transporter [Alphaproteobacteria bacterium]